MPRLLAVLLLALVVPSSALAAPSRVTRVAAMPSTDGRSVAAWTAGGALRVLADDDPLGGEALLPAPPECALAGISGTSAAYDCPDGGEQRRVRLQDLATGAVRDTPVAFLGYGPNSESYALDAIGSTFAIVHTGGGIHSDADDQYFRLADGSAVPDPVATTRRAVSLDAAAGTVALCAPLTLGHHRVTAVDDFDGTTATYDAADPVAYRPPWLLTVHRGRALLKRCGSARVRDLGPGSVAGKLVLTRRYAAWAPAIGSPLRVHLLASHRTSTYVLPLRHHPVGAALAATDRRLWVSDRQGDTFMIAP